MFKGLGNLGNVQGLFKQVLEVKTRMEEVRASLASEQVEASAGGGMVAVVVNGCFEVVSLKIDPEVIDRNDPEMLETLVRSAMNEAVRKAQELVKGKLSEVTGGLDIPGLTS